MLDSTTARGTAAAFRAFAFVMRATAFFAVVEHRTVRLILARQHQVERIGQIIDFAAFRRECWFHGMWNANAH